MKIAFLGDIAVFNSGLLSADYKAGLSDIRQVLAGCDLVIGNLEVPVTSREKTRVCKGIHLKTDARIIDVLKYLGVNAVCLANNHICDFEIAGMEDTIKLLERNSIGYYGVNNIKWYYCQNNEKIAFNGYCCYSTNGAKYIDSKRRKGVNALSVKTIQECLEQDAKEKALSVLSLHWGDEYSNLPNEMQVHLFEELSEHFDFIIHGHHAHVMQGIEKCNNSLALYNLGNFCFDECTSPVNNKLKIKQSEENKESYITIVEVKEGRVINYKTVGIYYNDNAVHIIHNEKKIKELSEKIPNCSTERYKKESKEMVIAQKQNNLQKHDFKWFVSKMNYYSIGAKLASYHNKRLFRKAMEIEK